MSTEASRQYDWVDDKNAAVPITASRMDAEFDAIITKLNEKVIIGASAPTSPIAGELWLDSTNKILKQYRNSEWVTMGIVHVGTSAPTTKQEGDIWWDSTNDVLYVYTSTTAKNTIITGASFGTLGQMITSQGVGSTPTNLAMGNYGQLLKSQGYGSVPLFQNMSDILSEPVNTASVNTTALKTTMSEITSSSAENKTLPGGTYGFYPQIKYTGAGSGFFYVGHSAVSAAYVTNIYFDNASAWAAQQRYISASGEDMWIFLLIDKNTNDVVSAYQAPDHPAYGNGGDFDAVPHPFPSYNPAKHEMAILDKDTCLALEEESKQTGKSMLTLVNEEYRVNMEKEEIYQSMHSGKYINENNIQIKHLIETLPDYIKVRKLKKATQKDKEDKITRQAQKFAESKALYQSKVAKIKQKLNLTDEDLQDLKAIL